MLRRAVPPALLLALGLVSGVLVARLPPDLETTVVTRRHHGADPLLSAVLLRFGVDSLLHHPSRYFQPPILFPDPNPLRGTEPLVAEALLAVPFRLALGDRPAAVYTWVKIVTLALLTLGTGLMLKELGVRLSLCLLGGGLTVLVSTTVVFADRLQAVSLQWLPLSVLFALRYWRSGRPSQAAAFAVCLFLTVQASLYTTVMLLAVAPFLAPLLLVLRGEANARSRATGLALGAAAAGGALPAHPAAVRHGPRGRGRLRHGRLRLREELEPGLAHGPAHEPARVRPARVAAGAGLLLGRDLPGHRVRPPRGWPGRARRSPTR